MNINILQKILTELGKESPSIDYLKGMVETLIAMTPGNLHETFTAKDNNIHPVARTESISDEEIIPDFLKTGPIGRVG